MSRIAVEESLQMHIKQKALVNWDKRFFRTSVRCVMVLGATCWFMQGLEQLLLLLVPRLQPAIGVWGQLTLLEPGLGHGTDQLWLHIVEME